jgi:hypothetical protein
MKLMCSSGSVSNQPELLPIEYRPPPPTSKPPGEKKAKWKAKPAGKKKSNPKKKKKQVAAPHDSPAMGTRSKTTPTSIALQHIPEAKGSFHFQI